MLTSIPIPIQTVHLIRSAFPSQYIFNHFPFRIQLGSSEGLHETYRHELRRQLSSG